MKPRPTTAIASKRGLSTKKRRQAEEVEEDEEKDESCTYRISPGRVIFLSWMLK